MSDAQNATDEIRYYVIGIRPVRLRSLEDGGVEVLKFDGDTGTFVPGVVFFEKAFWGGDEVDKLSENEFIQQTERLRRERFTGDNAVFTLYKLIDTIEATAAREARDLTMAEEAIILLTQRKTFALFEQECRLNENYRRK